MKQILYIGLALCAMAGCRFSDKPALTDQKGTWPDSTPKNQEMANNTPFERAVPALANGTSLIMNREPRGPHSLADFLARTWNLYGKPDAVHFEGFSYTFRHKESGTIFTVYSAGSGPAYGGDETRAEQLLPIIHEFDALLDSTGFADCEITYDTDFGTYRAGCKNGNLFEEPLH